MCKLSRSVVVHEHRTMIKQQGTGSMIRYKLVLKKQMVLYHTMLMVNVLKHVWIVEHFYSQMWIKKCYVQVWPSLNRAYYHENRIAYYKVWKFLCSIRTRPPNTIPYITYVKFPMFKTLNGQFFQGFHIAAIGYGKYLFIFYWKTVRK